MAKVRKTNQSLQTVFQQYGEKRTTKLIVTAIVSVVDYHKSVLCTEKLSQYDSGHLF